MALRLTVYSNGSKIEETVEIVSVEIAIAINRIPTAKLVILDGDMPNQKFPVSDSEQFKPGAEIEISAGFDASEETIFKGIVVKHGIKITRNNYARLVVECKDKAVAMTVGRKNANYVDQKDSDIIASLVGGYSGLSSDVSATETQHKQLVQYYCTDWDFMLARAEANGLLVNVDAAKVSVKPPQTDGSAAFKVSYGIDLYEFHAELDARTQLSSVKSVGWDLASQAVVEQEAQAKSLNAQGNLGSSDLAQVLGLSSFRLQSPVPLETAEAKAWADAQQLKAGLARIRGRVKFKGNALAKPGALIELAGVGERFNGMAFVGAATHRLEEGDWLTEAEFGLSPAWFAEQRDLLAPPASGLTSGIEGLHVGVVKKLDEDPDGQNKVQVSTPIQQAEIDGVWARLSSFYGSKGFGAFFVPEIGDEVILGYFNDDPSHPVILGSLYSSDRAPPYPLAAENNFKAIVTRSKLKLEFDEDKKVIALITPGNNKIVISDDDKSILLQDQNGNKIKLGGDGILLDSPKDIAIKAKGKVTVDALGNVEVSSKGDIKQQALNIDNAANVSFTAKGNASAELSASGQTTVKGALVMIN
jgi:Rhs element Vgr protein